MKFIDIEKSPTNPYCWIANFEYKKQPIKLSLYASRKNVSKKQMQQRALDQAEQCPVGYAIRSELKKFDKTEFELAFFKYNVNPPKSKKAAWNKEYREQLGYAQADVEYRKEDLAATADDIKDAKKRIRELERWVKEQKQFLKESRQEVRRLEKLK